MHVSLHTIINTISLAFFLICFDLFLHFIKIHMEKRIYQGNMNVIQRMERAVIFTVGKLKL